MSAAYEVNFDGLVGPTHNYGGLAFGNLASASHSQAESNPQQAALQGLEKMKLLAGLGLRQAILPPHDRPHIETLRCLGFSGSDPDVLQQAARDAPGMLAAASSASSMWAANAATVSSSADTEDARVHFTPANLTSCFHRSIEPPTTCDLLRAIFADQSHFVVHDPLPPSPALGDEGAANHTRLCAHYGDPGLEVFTYGADEVAHQNGPRRYPVRQTLAASRAVARLHRIQPGRAIFLQQSAAAIDAGVFHHDVAAVGNQNVLFFHTGAFADYQAPAILRQRFTKHCGGELKLIAIEPNRLTLADAVATYLFNSQLVTLADRVGPAADAAQTAHREMALICPIQCQQHRGVAALLDEMVQGDSAIASVRYVDLQQSMQNGGGPACLRLRVVMTEAQIAAMHQGVIWTPSLHTRLQAWVERNYRDRLHPTDLTDPQLLNESRQALDELTSLLGLGSLYGFQRAG